MNQLYRILDKIIQYGTLLFVFLIPWQARLILVPGSINDAYWEYGTQSLYATEFFLFIILIALIVKGVIVIKSRKPNFSVKKVFGPIGLLSILVAWSGLSIIWPTDSSVALEHWIVLVEAGVVFLIISSRSIPFYKISWAIILSGVIQSILAFAQFRWHWLPASTILGTAYQQASILGTSVVETDMARWLRGYGTFPHPNMLGGWLVLSMILAIEKVRITPVAYIPIAILSLGLAVTFSRGAWLAFALSFIAVIIYAFIKKNDLKKIALSVLVIILFVGTLVAAYPEPFAGRLGTSGRLEVKSNQERVVGYSQAWDVIKQNRILGAGIGNYGLGVYEDIDDSQEAYFYQPVHNTFLLIWAELGVIGLILVIVLMLMIVNFVYLGLKKKQDISTVFIFMFPLVILALFDHYLWSLYSGLMILVAYISIFWLKLAKNR
jgi:O-antigen ligase